MKEGRKDRKKECQQNSSQITHQVKLNQIKSNQIKPYQIKSNQVKSIKVRQDERQPAYRIEIREHRWGDCAICSFPYTHERSNCYLNKK